MISEERGIVSTLQAAHFDAVVFEQFFSDSYDVATYADSVRRLTNRLNNSVLETMHLATKFMENRSYADILVQWDALKTLKEQDKAVQDRITAELDTLTPRAAW